MPLLPLPAAPHLKRVPQALQRMGFAGGPRRHCGLSAQQAAAAAGAEFAAGAPRPHTTRFVAIQFPPPARPAAWGPRTFLRPSSAPAALLAPRLPGRAPGFKRGGTHLGAAPRRGWPMHAALRRSAPAGAQCARGGGLQALLGRGHDKDAGASPLGALVRPTPTPLAPAGARHDAHPARRPNKQMPTCDPAVPAHGARGQHLLEGNVRQGGRLGLLLGRGRLPGHRGLLEQLQEVGLGGRPNRLARLVHHRQGKGYGLVLQLLKAVADFRPAGGLQRGQGAEEAL